MGNVAAVNTFCKNSMWAQKGVFLIGGKKKKSTYCKYDSGGAKAACLASRECVVAFSEYAQIFLWLHN